MVVRRDISSAVKLRNRVAEFLEDYSWFDTRIKQLDAVDSCLTL